MNLKKELRRKADSAFYIADNPTNERYALINEKYDGYCPFIDEDGYCSLQRACGEDVLPIVCRMYPRSVKLGEENEISCSLSCEKTVELIISNTEKLKFEEYTADIPEGMGIHTRCDSLYKRDMRNRCIEKMSDRLEPIPIRLYTVGKIVTDIPKENAPEIEKIPVDIAGMDIIDIANIIFSLSRKSHSVEVCGNALLKLGITEDTLSSEISVKDIAEKYKKTEEKFYSFFPNADIYFEKILQNHMFYMQFPYVEILESRDEAFSALVLVYALMKMTVVLSSYDGDIEKFIFSVTEVFKLAEHSDFYSAAPVFLKRHGFMSEERLFALMYI